MLLLTRENLLTEKTRLALSVSGIALTVLLITMLVALYRGWDEKVGTFVAQSSVDVWVTSPGARDFLGAASLLPVEGPDAVDAHAYLNDHEAVAAWSPLIVRPMDVWRIEAVVDGSEKQGQRIDALFIGFDPLTGLGGPLRVVEGRGDAWFGEIIVDSALSQRYGVEIGDVLRAAGKDWTVVGKSQGGDFVGTQTVFAHHDHAQAALGMVGATTFYAVSLVDGTDAREFADEIVERAPDEIVAYTRDEFAGNTRERVLGDVLPLLVVVLGLAFVVGMTVAGLTVYTSTVAHSREYGILKAVGFGDGYLYRLVVEKSVIMTVLGFGAGILVAFAIAPLITNYVPQFVVHIRWQDVCGIFGATLVMAVAAAYLPIRRIADLDPVSVFAA
ncbi:MAG TPA: ABC transporter permease [Dehalococcoidia bacterium]|nr:ABC transporter permease [Dehalococcoidia bacterium]